MCVHCFTVLAYAVYHCVPNYINIIHRLMHTVNLIGHNLIVLS